MSYATDITARIRIEVSGIRDLERGASASSRSLGNLERQARRTGRSYPGGPGGGNWDPGRPWMRASYYQEQAATQLHRVGNAAQRSLEQPVRLAADFEDQMGRVSALVVRGLSDDEARKVTADLSAEARRLGATTRYTAAEAGEGMEFLAMAGYDAQRQIQSMPAVLNLASIGALKVSRAADIATNVMGGFQIGAEDSIRVVDRLAAALTGGNVTLTEIGNSMKYLGPVAKAAGQDLESSLGWLDVLGDAGIKGSQAGTSTREIIARLSSPKGGAKDVLRKYKIETVDEDGNLRDVTQILGELGLAMARSGKGNTEISNDVTTLIGKRARSSALVLMGAAAKGLAATDDDLSSLQALATSDVEGELGQSLDPKAREKLWKESLQSRIGRVRESDGLGADMAKRMDSTTKGRWREFKSAMEETGIVIGEQILPLLVELMEELKPVVIDVAKWAKEHPGVIKAMAKLGLATIALTAIATPILHLSSAIAALIGLGGRGVGGIFGPRGGGWGPGGGRRGPQPRDSRGRYMSWDEWERRGGGRRGGGAKAPRGGAAPVVTDAPRGRGAGAGKPSAVAKAGAAVAGWQIGTMIGESINDGLREYTGRDGVSYVEDYFINPASRMVDWIYGNDNTVTVNIVDQNGNPIGTERFASLDALHGGVTRQRGGPEFLSEIHGLTEENKRELEQLELEKKIAGKLGVTTEVVRRARQQGISAEQLSDRKFLESFVAQEQAKDAEEIRKEEDLKRRRAIASQEAKEKRQELLGKGAGDVMTLVGQKAAYERAMAGVKAEPAAGRGEQAASFLEGLRQVLATELKIKVEGAGVVGATGAGVNVEGVDTG